MSYFSLFDDDLNITFVVLNCLMMAISFYGFRIWDSIIDFDCDEGAKKLRLLIISKNSLGCLRSRVFVWQKSSPLALLVRFRLL